MICIPIANDNIRKMLTNTKRAVKFGANFVELRIDYLKNLNLKDLDALKDFKKLTVPVIFTCRKESEGGKNQLDEKFRLGIIKKLITLKPDYIDLEYSIEKAELTDLVNKCHYNNIKIILSFHDFKKTPRLSELFSLIKSMAEFRPDLIKIVTMATDIYDNNVIFNILEKAKKDGIELISFCMGKLGIVSRTMSPFLGSKLTFASLDIPTAPGQISIKEMKNIHNIIIERIRNF